MYFNNSKTQMLLIAFTQFTEVHVPYMWIYFLKYKKKKIN